MPKHTIYYPDSGVWMGFVSEVTVKLPAVVDCQSDIRTQFPAVKHREKGVTIMTSSWRPEATDDCHKQT